MMSMSAPLVSGRSWRQTISALWFGPYLICGAPSTRPSSIGPIKYGLTGAADADSSSTNGVDESKAVVRAGIDGGALSSPPPPHATTHAATNAKLYKRALTT